jgi:cytochrome c peroxidase
VVVIADTFADEVVLVDLDAGQVVARIALGPQGEPTIVDRGERLFYDARLSLDGWFSCHSCHTDGHTNGQRADTLGDGGFGAAKRVLTLLGTNDTGPWAWDASAPDLEGQIHKSLVTTLQGREPTSDQVMALAAYLRSLPPPPALGPLENAPGAAGAAPSRETFDPALAERGHLVFARRGCTACHTEGAFTTGGTFDVGLADELGGQRFNPPSLRGVSQLDELFHDNRAAALEEVFTVHGHRLEEPLDDGELRALIEFLRGL